MKILRELLFELDKMLYRLQAPILNKLDKGLSVEMIESSLKKINIINDSLIILYEWKNGVKDIYDGSRIEDLELFPEAIMFSLEEAINHYKISVDQLWNKGLFPIFTNGGGNYFLLNCNANDKNTGMILLYDPSLLSDENPQSIYDSFETLIETVLNCFSQDIYKINEDVSFDVDYDLKYELSARLNPKSNYWDEYR